MESSNIFLSIPLSNTKTTASAIIPIVTAIPSPSPRSSHDHRQCHLRSDDYLPQLVSMAITIAIAIDKAITFPSPVRAVACWLES